MSKEKTPRRSTKDMIRCPVCQALSYPRQLRDPKTEEEKGALICGSCNVNVVPYFEAIQEYLNKRKEQQLVEEKAIVDSKVSL